MRADLRTVTRAVVAAGMLVAQGIAASAATEVFPGPGTPLQDAIDASAPGATIVVHGGPYPEALSITKAVSVRAYDPLVEPVVIVDAGCAAPYAVHISADRVRLRGIVANGGTAAALLVDGARQVQLRGSSGIATCGGGTVGLQVRQSDRVQILGGGGVGGVAGCLFEDIASGSKVTMQNGGCVSEQSGAVGLRVRNASPGTTKPGRGGIVLRRRGSLEQVLVLGPSADVALEDADGVLLSGMTFGTPAAPESGWVDLVADAQSDNNKLACSTVTSTSVAGVGNCYRCGGLPPPPGLPLCP